MLAMTPILYFALRSKPGQGEAGISSAQTDALPKLYPVPDFTFTAQDGQPFGLKQLAGKVWVRNDFWYFWLAPGFLVLYVWSRHGRKIPV
mgnify:CR=1 FL=1